MTFLSSVLKRAMGRDALSGSLQECSVLVSPILSSLRRSGETQSLPEKAKEGLWCLLILLGQLPLLN